MLTPLYRAMSQLNDPVFGRVVLLSVAWSALTFALLVVGCTWLVHDVSGQQGWIGWIAATLGAVAAGLLALWLFIPAALLIATLYVDRIAAAVERRFYPMLPSPKGAPLTVQAWDGAVLGLQVLCLQVVALALALLLPGIGLVLGWIVTGWGLGRGLFVAVAMRRMPRPDALRLYGARRLPVVLQGIALAFVGTVPLLNLLVPVLGTAAMVHVLERRGL